MQKETPPKIYNLMPTYGISKPVKILVLVTLVLIAAIMIFGEYDRREKIKTKQLAAAQLKQAQADAWPAKKAAMDSQNVIAARQREADYLHTQHAATMAQAQTVLTRFHDLARVADAAPPAALASVIPQLQSIHRETQRLQFSDCMAPAQTALASAFDHTINFYLARMQIDPQAAKIHSQQAQTAIDQFTSTQQRCQ